MTLGKLTVTDCDGRGRRPRHHQAAVPNVWKNKTSCLISPLPKTTCCPRWERLCSSPVCLCSSPFLPIGWRLRPQWFWLEMEEEQLTMHTVQCALHTNHIVVPCPKDRQPPTYHFDRMGLKEETSREEGNMLALLTLTTTSTTSKLLNYSELGEGNDQELRGNCQISDECSMQ